MSRITLGKTCWKLNDYSLGGAALGGYLICRSGGVGWVVAPSTTEVSRSWYSRDDAVTTAEANAACGDWFVPTCGQLQNPGWVCNTYWDSFSSDCFWSSTEHGGSFLAWTVRFTDGYTSGRNKANACCVRAFRCVTY